MYTHCARFRQTNKQIKRKFNANRLVSSLAAVEISKSI